jgi:hypothetical protein
VIDLSTKHGGLGADRFLTVNLPQWVLYPSDEAAFDPLVLLISGASATVGLNQLWPIKIIALESAPFLRLTP